MTLGLTLPSAMGRSHEVPCTTPDACGEMSSVLPCEDCPPCPWEHDGSLPVEKDNHCPSPEHQHPHHHHCLCSSASAWLISGSEAFSLHPPVQGLLRSGTEFLFFPETPVSVFERPPIS